MATDDLSFSDISSTAIEQAEEYLVALLKEEYPSLDLTQGRVIRDEVIRPAAILRALDREDLDRLRRSFSPLAIEADPTLADADMVDKVYSNYRIERISGSRATGLVAVIIRDLATTAVPEETVFMANDLEFTVTQPYMGVTTADAVVTSSERLIEARTDGTYVFTVPVTASVAGEVYRVKRGTRFTASPAIAGTVELQAAQDFEGGLNAETNAELVARVKSGIAPSVFSARAQVESLLRSELPGLKAVSQVGYGDPEMLRDRHNVYQLSTGGKADIYVRTADVPIEIKLTKECTYVGDNIWQFSILRDDAPGYYRITAVVEKDNTAFLGSLEITEETRGLDLTAETDWVHDVFGLVEGAYSRYQTAVVKFRDTNTAGSTQVGAKADYDVYVLRMPDIKTLHDLTIDRSRRPLAGDYLVRAAVPALVSASFRIYQRPGTADPDLNAVKQAVAGRANSLGFLTGRLNMSILLDAAHGALESGGTAVILPGDLQAYIYPPDTAPADRIELRDPRELVIPDLPARGVTQRTTVFYLAAADIAVSTTPMPAKAI